MTKDENNLLNDPLFLVSRSIDGDLSAVEQIRLDKLLAASAGLRADAEKLRAVASLLESRRLDRAQVDWKLHEKLVLAHIDEGEADLADVDRLLQSWGQKSPDYNEQALNDAVMARVAPARKRRRSAWRIVARLGAPLAAAAAVVLAVTATWFAPDTQISLDSVTIVQIGPLAAGSEPDASLTVVTFARKTNSPPSTNESLTFGYMTLGSSPMGQTEESPL